jgi:hypothetical protein
MFIAQYYWCYESNIILTAFLITIPLLIILPIQLLIGTSKISHYEWISEIRSNKKKKTGRIITLTALGIMAILIAVSYIGVDYLI